LIKTRQCQKKARRCRRTLPKFGTPERLELLREDAKRRMREAASRHTVILSTDTAVSSFEELSSFFRSHSCSKCDRHFDNFSELRVHVSVEHPKIHHCQFCSFSHKWSGLLALHKLIYMVRAEVRKHTIINHGNGVTCTVTGCNLRIARWRLKYVLFDMCLSYSIMNVKLIAGLSNQLSSSSCDTGRATSSMSESISALDHSVEFPSDPEDSRFVPGVKPYSCRSCGISFSARSRFAVHLSKYHRMSIRDHRSISEFLEPSARNNSQS
uniref:C2H2-type domain-containing protein n=1 Tax=Angiostrongylus cantonensis TaxID=6313 RepID=A0A0K0CY18_ANGCA